MRGRSRVLWWREALTLVPFASFRRLVVPRNGAYAEFPDGLSTLDFSHLAAWQTASLKGSVGAP